MTGKQLIQLAILALTSTIALQAAVATATPEGFPFSNESLDYVVKFPTGITLGDAQLNAARSGRGWSLKLTLKAPLPNFLIQDSFSSLTTYDLCTVRTDRQLSHGSRKAQEFTTVDPIRLIASRATTGGGVTEMKVGACPHDALSFLYLLRREMGQGRMPADGSVLAGALYQVSLHYDGAKSISHNDKTVIVDEVDCSIKGPASTTRLEILFARDAARTPLIIRCPFALGSFYMELAR